MFEYDGKKMQFLTYKEKSSKTNREDVRKKVTCLFGTRKRLKNDE
jgi:hypothetical protein